MWIFVHKAKAGTAPSARDGGVAGPEANSGGASGCADPSCRWGPAAHALPPAGDAGADPPPTAAITASHFTGIAKSAGKGNC